MPLLIFTVLSFGSVLSLLAQSLPYSYTQAAGPIISSNVTLNGMVVPNSLPTTVWFEWGTNSSCGQTTPPVSIGNGTTVVRANAGISNLQPQFNYRCRVVASNTAGTIYGAEVLFTTGRRVFAWGDYHFGQTNVPPSLSNAVAVAGGEYHSLALNANGLVVAWGSNNYGQTNVPSTLSNVVAVAGGGFHNLALSLGGTIVAWGLNTSGQTNVPIGLSNVVAVVAGGSNSLALKADGTVVAWGNNSSGQTNVPVGLSNVVAVAGGGAHNLALRADGTVVAWGSNTSGQTNVPIGLSNVVAVAAGRSHSLALKVDGTVVAWGLNTSGQTNVPAGLSNVLAVAGGGSHSLALRMDGALFTWGGNSSGQTNQPKGLTNVVAIAGGGYHSLALGNMPPVVQDQSIPRLAGSGDVMIILQGRDPNGDPLAYRITALPMVGELYQWTISGRGSPITSPDTLVLDAGGRVIFSPPNLGNDSFAFVANDGMVDSAPATIFIMVVPAFAHIQATQPAGTTASKLCGMVLAGAGTKAWFEWGTVGNYSQKTTEMDMPGTGLMTPVTALLTNLAEQANYQCRLVASNVFGVTYGAPRMFTTGRRVVAWGDNWFYQISIPAGLSNVVAVAAGGRHSLALKANGMAAAWGRNTSGQTDVPTDLSNLVAIAAGGSGDLASAEHSLGLKADGTVVAWGNNTSGQTNVPTGLSNVVAVAGGWYHGLALKTDGTVVAWGNNASGQTNVPAGLSNVVAVAGGGSHSLALKVDGTVVAWGSNTAGQTNVPVALCNVVAVAGGGSHSVALKADGGVVAWGDNTYGQATIPSGLNNVVAVAGGGFHSLALKADGTVLPWGRGNSGQKNVPAGLSNVVAVAAGGYHNLTLGNLPPSAQDQTNFSFAGQDVTITLQGSDANGDFLTYRVVTLPTAGKLFQWTPSGRGSSITATNSVVEDIGGRVILDFPLSSNSSFTFILNDGLSDSAPATVVVDSFPAPVIDVSNLSMGSGGEFFLSFVGFTNASYHVWASTNLTTWSVLGSATQSPPGVFQFTDTTATNWPQRFYRATCP